MTLIIGIGNPLRGDDAVGAEAIRALEARSLPPQVKTVHAQQLSMDLAEALGAASLAIFIDARLGDPPGELRVQKLEPDSCLSAAGVSHFFDPATLLAAVQALYGQHPKAWLFSVNAQTFDFGAPLSPPVREALPLLLALVLDIVHPAGSIAPG